MYKGIKDMINEYKGIMENKQIQEVQTVKFSVNLDIQEMRRLDYLCNYMNVKRATLASDMISAAIADFEIQLGLVPKTLQLQDGEFTGLTELQVEYMTEVLRFGKSDTISYKDGQLTVTDEDGNTEVFNGKEGVE
jgi:hypothetical protein